MKSLRVVLAVLTFGAPAQVGGPIHPDGTEVHIDLPAERHQKNVGGRDGAGLCVFTSIGMAADWAGETVLIDFRDWMRQHPGGGYPSKVDRMITQLCKERNAAPPAYLQIQSNDLELLAQAVRQGHLASVTYCRSPTGRYGGQRVAHMVNCVAARAGGQRLWAVLDNSYPGTIEWMTEEQFRAAYTGLGGGWAVPLLQAGPPPVPRN